MSVRLILTIVHQKHFFTACSDVYEYIIGRGKFNLIKFDAENDKIIIDFLHYLNYVGYVSFSVSLREIVVMVKVSDSSKIFICMN